MNHAVCLGCGCACDDIDVRVDAGRIVEARRACALGAAWFGDGQAPSRVLVDGRDTNLSGALDAAAALLDDASSPLVYLAPDISCETQREAVGLADALRAALDSETGTDAIASVVAAQERGRASATLGEVRQRADLVVFWGVDPAHRYPRYRERYAGSGRVIAVDVGSARGPADADARISLTTEAEVATLTRVTAWARLASAPEEASGQEPAAELFALLTSGRYVAVVADAEGGTGTSGRSGALIALTQALNDSVRCALITLRAGGNRSGSDAVMTSQTGYPAAVDFARGFPRYRPFDGTAMARLARREVDALAIVGAAGAIPARLADLMSGLPAVVLGPRASDSSLAARRVVIDTGVAGIHESGTALRMDDVALPLRRVIEGPPPAAPIVRDLRARLDVRRHRCRRRA